MATLRQAYEAIGTGFGISSLASRNVAESCQASGLIRTGPRGQGVHLTAPELTSLLLAHTVEPRSEIGIRVPRWRATPPSLLSVWAGRGMLERESRRRGCCFGEAGIAMDIYRDELWPDLPKQLDADDCWSGMGEPRCYQTLPGESLGEAMDLLVDYLSLSKGKPLGAILNRALWRLRLSSTDVAEVSYSESGVVFSSFFQQENYQLTQPMHVRQDIFSVQAFQLLADLWSDTKAHTAGEHIGLNTSKPKRKKAANGHHPESDLLSGQTTKRLQSSSLNKAKDTLSLQGGATPELRSDRSLLLIGDRSNVFQQDRTTHHPAT